MSGLTKSKAPLVGLELPITTTLNENIQEAKAMGYGFVSVHLFHPALKLDYLSNESKLNKAYPLTRTDMVLQESEINNMNLLIIGKMSAWIDCDSPDDYYRRNSEKALISELSWAAHLGLPVVQVALRRAFNPNLARLLNSFLERERKPFRIWVVIPICLGETSNSSSNNDCESENDFNEKHLHPWHWWFQLISLCCENSAHFSILLDIHNDLPSDSREFDRWFSEPLAALRFTTSTFMTNRRGYPVLSQSHQRLIKSFLKLNIQVIISGSKRHSRGFETYQQYISHLQDSMSPDDVYSSHAKGVEDYLQEPLQPLADNLSSATYAIFELDPYKYRAYEQAVYRALLDRHGVKPYDDDDVASPPTQPPSSPPPSNELDELKTMPQEDGDQNKIKMRTNVPVTVIMVLGAGRGPLVAACIKASKRAGLPIRVYIVEKNPNAIITLRSRIDDEWKNEDIIFLPGDMRCHEPAEKADIFVSELLGSFGDNELSPECLNGAQKYLKDDGISIPSSYTSYLAPMQSWKIYKEITGDTDRFKPERASFETPYVVCLKNCHVLTQPKPAFTFVHPKVDPLDDGSRFITQSFRIEQDAVIHGLAGYFHSILYEDVTMSIHPQFHSPDMFSWFPLVFPLRFPVVVKAGDLFTVNMWRVVGPRSVWYEWCVTEPFPGPIHNPGGRSYSIGI